MGINPTQSNFKSFTFDGVNSRQYGVYITGAGVFNAPERNVEMLDIAGRNGAFVLDKGSFLNIEVTYPASIACDNETDFAEAVSDLRNLLCSKVGYVRLEDDYNPNEYRLAIYKSGLEVSHDFLIAGEFDLVFECKPQRYLKTGETAISVTSGDTITNPTRFDAKPMLQVWGYGGFAINGEGMSLDNSPIGLYVAKQAIDTTYSTSYPSYSYEFDDTFANVGDSIGFSDVSGVMAFTRYACRMDAGTITEGSTTVTDTYGYTKIEKTNGKDIVIESSFTGLSFSYGTAETKTITATDTIINSTYGIVHLSVTTSFAYDGIKTMTLSYSITVAHTAPLVSTKYPRTVKIYQTTVDSTMLAYGAPIYIDLDIGEAYKEESGVWVSVNNAVSLPSELPTLASGANTITYDNTFTQFKVVPRWWKV